MANPMGLLRLTDDAIDREVLPRATMRWPSAIFGTSAAMISITRGAMRISVFSWIIAALLGTFSLWIIVAAYLDRNRAGCTPSCSDLRVPMIIAAGVLFGAIVSASIGQLSKSRPKYIKWLIRVGGVIFFLASSAFLISTSPVALVLIFVSLIVNTMIILRGRTHSTGNDHHVRSGKLP